MAVPIKFQTPRDFMINIELNLVIRQRQWLEIRVYITCLSQSLGPTVIYIPLSTQISDFRPQQALRRGLSADRRGCLTYKLKVRIDRFEW
jgi:hypothetical protein